jgi:hypothetical protein
MKQVSLMLRGATLAAALCAASVPALAQPSQWTKGDKTAQQRTAILKKEISAAYAEQQTVCKRQAAAQRSSCIKSARMTYQRDLANVPRLVANAPQSEVMERVVSVTPAAPAAPAAPAPGSTSYGNSGAGPASDSSGSSASSGSSGAGATSAGAANASANAASRSAPASTGAAPGTPHSSVSGEGDQSGAMMPEPTKPIQPQGGSAPDAAPAQQK